MSDAKEKSTKCVKSFMKREKQSLALNYKAHTEPIFKELELLKKEVVIRRDKCP